MITVIVIPANRRLPPRLERRAADDLPGFQALVGGYLEALRLTDPAATLYLNEEGKDRQLPLNPRATAVAWVHNPAFRGADVIAGDVVLAGPPDAAGELTAAPDRLVTVLLRSPRVRVETRRGQGGWVAGRRTFDDVFAAYLHALALVRHDRRVSGIRVVPARAPRAARHRRAGR
jgi:hypothetical protein